MSREETPIIEDSTLTDLYARRDELQERIKKDEKDWTAKHLLQSVQDEITKKRKSNLEKENNSL